MAIAMREGEIEYTFGEGWTVSRYDQWSYYTKHFQSAFGGAKAMDVAALDPMNTLWLIEIKDFSLHLRTNPLEPCDELSFKVRDTLAGIFAAATWHADHPAIEEAKKFLSAKKIRLVFHLEQRPSAAKLFCNGAIDMSKLLQKLKQLVGSIDPHPVIVSVDSFGMLPWSASKQK